METYKQRTLNKIARIKLQSSGTVAASCEIGKSPFELISLTKDDVQNPHIIRILARWRKKHELWFPAQFPVTEKRTKDWLQKRVIDEPDRLLFMIRIHGTYRGHVGLYRFDFAHYICEIDNIVRGRSGTKGLMEHAIITMMQWGEKELGLRGYSLQTTSDNERAIALYTRLGFIETDRIPLKYEKTNEGGQWVAVSKDTREKIKRYDVYMKCKETGN